MKRRITAFLCVWLMWAVGGVHPPVAAQEVAMADDPARTSLDIDNQTTGDLDMTLALGRLDYALRVELGIEGEQTAVGLLDMNTGRLAMLRADTQYYAASVPKIAILLAYFQTHPEAADSLDEQTRQELGMMVKVSSNEMAAKYSKLLGLQAISDVLTSPAYRFYDPLHGGGLWMGKHYGPSDERNRDPIAGESHAATVRQLLRYYLMLEQGRLVSPAASGTMREIFESPRIDHLQSKFVLALKDRDLQIIRKSGTWSEWFADTAVIQGEGRYYILVSLTHTEKGNEYLTGLARSVDDWAIHGFRGDAPVNPATNDDQQEDDNG